jgi:Kef-type K+ transport system membrane component KefB
VVEIVLLGGLSFLLPFPGALLVARYALGWDWRAAEIAGAAMSTTSVTDIGTATALTVLFIKPTLWMLPFVAASVLLITVMPRMGRWFFARYGNRVIEPELKGAFATFQRHHVQAQRFRVVAFAMLTPFFFLRSGMNVSLAAVWANLGLLGVFLTVKVTCKLVGVYPLARRYMPEQAAYTTLLMSTGLTFGTISATYGLNAGIINRAQFSVLVSVVVLTAVVPTAIAQRLFAPRREPAGAEPEPAAAGTVTND